MNVLEDEELEAAVLVSGLNLQEFKALHDSPRSLTAAQQYKNR